MWKQLSYTFTATGPGASLVYDARGNTTRLADQTLAHDISDRYTGTVLDAGTIIEYLRDAADRVVQRTVKAGPTGIRPRR
ncbi:hypothetical protein [Protaetiibacter larvae]|uniref:Uncharacterized protein n=1 Tax=Protaetiibacter larvae TaxID=2592654 RepID=A0A5C1Y4A8_9MICO|nr:hypothetical protein [Protaetiibacter larvae]QEO08596.1 hypothetical protein FLP23_00255 [Protaetiibacter larvae]